MEAILVGVVIGIVTAAVLGIIAWLWQQGRESRVKDLANLMGTIIEHRNAGKRPVSDPVAWVQRAKELEAEAEEKAGKVSAASRALIHSLGDLEEFSVDKKIRDFEQIRYVGILTTVISRIRDTLGRHDR